MRLIIDANETRLLPNDAVPSESVSFEMGWGQTGTHYFRHEPPTPIEIENAIAAVEDELWKARGLVVAGAVLRSSDVTVREIARLAGLSTANEVVMSRELVERTFNRLVAVVEGTPASLEGMPTNRRFAATLLILRELMHHLGFESLTISDADSNPEDSL